MQISGCWVFATPEIKVVKVVESEVKKALCNVDDRLCFTKLCSFRFCICQLPDLSEGLRLIAKSPNCNREKLIVDCPPHLLCFIDAIKHNGVSLSSQSIQDFFILSLNHKRAGCMLGRSPRGKRSQRWQFLYFGDFQLLPKGCYQFIVENLNDETVVTFASMAQYHLHHPEHLKGVQDKCSGSSSHGRVLGLLQALTHRMAQG